MHRGGWPAWPSFDERTVDAVAGAVRSGRWTVTGGWTGVDTYERRFADRFAELVGVRHCVSTDHGSSSLVLALEALGVGAGDEVVVPVLTWVATATAVLNVNAVPVFVDVDPATGCMAPEALAAALTERTTAVIAVHLNCRMADMDAILAVAAAAGVPVVEDGAQAHGARWRGRVAGSLGAVGAFSMQQGKVLTCGEGGAVVTGDDRLYDRLVQLRADSRRYRDDEPRLGDPYLTDAGDVMGTNCCLSEPQAALLLDQLDRLEAQLERREKAAAFLDRELGHVDGLHPLERSAHLERASVFRYALRCDPEALAGRPAAVVGQAIGAELGVRVHPTDEPLHRNALYCPQTKERYRGLHDRLAAAARGPFPVAERLYDELVLIPHNVLLAGDGDLDHVVEACAKVAALAGSL
ncbi:MAG: DegT/DnrJ/EryC1/StrS family aminotransferase [Actinobacteria bacterium]|nr:DegT/DnrJ/EryC1/StrS family aminotransferase [Actinomycetota bacterium]